MIEFDNDKMQELKRDSINKMLYDIDNIVRLGSELHEDRQCFIRSFNLDYSWKYHKAHDIRLYAIF